MMFIYCPSILYIVFFFKVFPWLLLKPAHFHHIIKWLKNGQIVMGNEWKSGQCAKTNFRRPSESLENYCSRSLKTKREKRKESGSLEAKCNEMKGFYNNMQYVTGPFKNKTIQHTTRNLLWCTDKGFAFSSPQSFAHFGIEIASLTSCRSP